MHLPDWCAQLRSLRDDSGLSRSELARRSGVSAGTIKAYETNARTPSRPMLTAILDCLKADRHSRHRVLESAGFAADGTAAGLEHANPEFSFREAMAEIESSPWPAFIANETMELVGANT